MKSKKRFSVISLFPETVESYVNSSILGRATSDKLISLDFLNPKDFTDGKWDRVDQKPFGGGPGMVLEAMPFLRAWQKAKGRKRKVKTIFFSPSGKQFNQEDAIRMAKDNNDMIFICGRYEGIDQRVVDITNAEVYSVGPYVLTGGELPAMIMIDSISRQVPGVLGDINSLEENRVSSAKVYTKPRSLKWKGKNYDVPEVLFSGNHAEIDKWKLNN